MGEDEPVSRREFDSYKHYNEMQRDADSKALQSQVAGVASVLSTHFEDDRRSFEELRKQMSAQASAATKWFVSISLALVGVLGGIIAVLVR